MSMSQTGKSHRLKQDISIPSAVLSGSLLQQIAIRHQREKVAITTLFKMAGVVCLTVSLTKSTGGCETFARAQDKDSLSGTE